MIIQKTVETALSFKASKWLHTQFLVDREALDILFQRFGTFFIFSTQGLQAPGKNSISKEQCLELYGRYAELMREGIEPKDEEFRFGFTALWTRCEEAVQAIRVADGREMIRPIEPIIQLQLHRFDISKDDGKVRPMVFGKNTRSWGLQASFPQLFADPITGDIVQVLKEPRFQNNELFSIFREWVREYTMPTPMVVNGKKLYAPIRIGKNCLEWRVAKND